MRKLNLSITLLAAILISVPASAKEWVGANKTTPKPNPEVTAGCLPPSAATELDINNTRALIQSGGDMWWDFNSSQYEIPKGSGKTALFAGSLWMGGQDVSGQLKIAAIRFRQDGTDFWTGPLSTVTSEITAETCAEYDKHFVTFRDQVATFVGWYEAGLFDAENGTTTQQEDFPGYSIPDTILNWPAHGRNFPPFNEEYNLAPFIDRNGDLVYNPLDGDYPAYDLKGEADCSDRNIVNIYGDMNLWWVFNDKGNVHTETGAQAIGMEVRAQAFAFATNDEVNNMTFYNYELINRSTFTLTETYFGQWVDADLGNFQDDYVGCDVQRGLGYCYNGDQFDEDQGGAFGYGEQPPAIGVDFFQGPFQDNDGIDNPLTTNIPDAISQLGIPYGGIGIGYGDQQIDNERFGMRKFLYHNNGQGGPNVDPQSGVEYYNYLRSIWRDGTGMVYGGNGHINGGGDPTVPADYMFPDDTDPLGWGTGGNVQPPWNEITAGNTPDDRRFMQSAGPFTLAPGSRNFITVGVAFAQAESGGNFASVEELRRADDKTQALFDNCFKVLNGPDAPNVSIQELNRELILYIDNPTASNNFNEEYEELSPFIFPPDTIDGVPLSPAEKEAVRTYTFQGYLVYQLKNQSVSAADLDNPDLARLIAQTDVKDGVGQIVNLYFDKDLGQSVPVEEVNGKDEGIVHSFKITEDEFASGNKTLVNHKQYYFMVLAYSHNKAGGLTPSDPYLYVQEPFLASRKSAIGGIKAFAGIPHITEVESGGTILNSEYGDGVELTRIEGKGNGGRIINMKKESIDEIMSGSPWRVAHPTYERAEGPVDIKVIDPLNVVGGDFTIALKDTIDSTLYDLGDAHWVLWQEGNEDSVYANKTIAIQNEQLILDWGISVTIKQANNPDESDDDPLYGEALLSSSLSFDDESKPWLSGIPDVDQPNALNWIRSGTATDPNNPQYDDFAGLDDDEAYEGIIGGTWTAAYLTTDREHGPLPISPGRNTIYQQVPGNGFMQYLHSVDIVFTADQSKWTRVPVIEMQDDPNLSVGGVAKGRLRKGASLDKNGNPATKGSGGSTNEEAPNFVSDTGMSWFPGYAIDIETGERLNMAFGEDSWLASENGNDMIWNPTSNIAEGVFGADIRMGGKHYVYVFRNNIVEDGQNAFPFDFRGPEFRMPAYDGGRFAFEQLAENTAGSLRSVYRAASWVGLPLLSEGEELLATDVKISIRVSKAFDTYATDGARVSLGQPLTVGQEYYVRAGIVVHGLNNYPQGSWFTAESTTFDILTSGQPGEADSANVLITVENGGRPMYTFNTDDLAPVHDSLAVAEDALDLINVVPNPYYAYSEYETDRLDNRIKFTNLPEQCTVSIYSVKGTLIRRYQKDDPTITSLDWDLKNQARIPVASGVYIIHVDVPGVGEKIIKWFGALRPVDLDSF